MKKIMIIGATSKIAENCARIWVSRGDYLYLVGRNKETLQTIAKDLKVRGALKVETYCMDLNNVKDHSVMLDAAVSSLKGIDIVLIAHGTLPNQISCQHSPDETLLEIQTNALSTISLLTLIANSLETNKAGTIAVITSVAGDRGRASNYVYGSAKAMVNEFMSGLRQRLHKSNVAVVTIKPGFVDTPMTVDFKKNLLWSNPHFVATKIVNAIDANKDEVYVPIFWQAVMMLIRNIPTKFFKRIRL